MLTDPECKNARCPEGKNRLRLTDSRGLYLEVAPSGSKRWFWKYYFNGKEKRLALGKYPEISAKRARSDREDARKVVESGQDPVQRRKTDVLKRRAQSAITFEAVARELHGSKASIWSESHSKQWLRGLEKDVFPWLGSLPLADVTPQLLLHALQRVEKRGAIRTAHDLREFAGQVFRYGLATGRCERNVAADLRGALKPYVEKHMGAVLEPANVGELLRAIDGYSGQPTTRAALALSALLFQRPGNVRMMQCADVNLDDARWTIPSAKMKGSAHAKLNGRPHIVPLAPQAVAILRDLYRLTGHGQYVFPSLRTGERCMSENTVRAALRSMGYDNDTMTPHGFRAMARTLLIERLPGVSADVIEAQLAHGKSGPLGSAYDRAEFMDQRRKLMVQWADYLDKLRGGGDVLPAKAA